MSYEENSDNGLFNENGTDCKDQQPSLDNENTTEFNSSNDGFYAYKKPESTLENEYQGSYDNRTSERTEYQGSQDSRTSEGTEYQGSYSSRTPEGTEYQGSYHKPASDNTKYRTQSGSVKKNKKHGRKLPAWLKVIIFAVVFGLVAALVFQGVTYGLFKSRKPSDTMETEEAEETEASESEKKEPEIKVREADEDTPIVSSVADLVEECMPSVVSVSTLSVQQVRDWFGGYQEYESEGRASGIIVGKSDTELLIVTNNHVVANAKELTVSFIDEKSATASVKGTNAEKDVAVMAVKLEDLDEATLDAISIATLGDSDSLRVGEDAIIIGNALGYGQSVTKGIISALNREFVYDEYGINCNMIQTDAAINPGNSGGALLNAKGEVVGISDSKDVDVEVESICYAIPISSVKDLITDFMNRETRDKVSEDKRGILGIRGAEIDSQTAQIYNMPKGIYISETIEGLGAAKAGMLQGDIIVSADGQQVSSLDDLSEVLSYFKVGETVEVTVERLTKEGAYEYVTLDVEVSKYDE